MSLAMIMGPGPALGLKTPTTGDPACVPLDTTARFLSLVPALIHEAQDSPLPRRRGWPRPRARAAADSFRTYLDRNRADRGVPISWDRSDDRGGEPIR